MTAGAVEALTAVVASTTYLGQGLQGFGDPEPFTGVVCAGRTAGPRALPLRLARRLRVHRVAVRVGAARRARLALRQMHPCFQAHTRKF